MIDFIQKFSEKAKQKDNFSKWLALFVDGIEPSEYNRAKQILEDEFAPTMPAEQQAGYREDHNKYANQGRKHGKE